MSAIQSNEPLHRFRKALSARLKHLRKCIDSVRHRLKYAEKSARALIEKANAEPAGSIGREVIERRALAAIARVKAMREALQGYETERATVKAEGREVAASLRQYGRVRRAAQASRDEQASRDRFIAEQRAALAAVSVATGPAPVPSVPQDLEEDR